MAFVVKAAVFDPDAPTYAFQNQKTMYRGKTIAAGDVVFVFASENEGGRGLIARGVVTSVEHVPAADAEAERRSTPRVSIALRREASAKRSLGRVELKPFRDWGDGRPQTELAFKLYRQATNKIVAISDEAAAFLLACF